MRMRLAPAAALAVSLGLAASLPAPAAGRPEIDVAALVRPAAAATRAQRLRADPALAAMAALASIDERYGVPSFVWAAGAERRAPALATSPTPARGAAEQAAREHLARLAPLYGLSDDDVRQAVLRAVDDTGRGGLIASFRQEVGGIEVFRDEVRVLMTRDLGLVAIAGNIPARPGGAAATPPAFALAPEAAIARALEDYAGVTTVPARFRPLGAVPGRFERFDAAEALGPDLGGARVEPVRVKRVLFHAGDALLPAYYLELLGDSASYSYVVSADDGRLLFRHDLVERAAFGYRVWADTTALHAPLDGPQGDAPTPEPSGVPDSSYLPAAVPPPLVTLDSGPISTHDPWLPAGASVTTGNNADAYADLAPPDGFSSGDLRASTTSPGTFDRTFDVTQLPGASPDQRMAAVTQLFYDVNFLHDWFYDAGFSEASGNAQSSNLGRGGVEGDALHAEAQDYGGVDNANMRTPADGGSPRMQMYVWGIGSQRVNVPAPAAVAGSYFVGTADFGPQTFSVTAPLVLANDGAGLASDACSAITNNVAGAIALVDRGACSFATEVQNAQLAGAVGVIVVDNVASNWPPNLTGTPTIGITIPSVAVTQALGDSIEAHLAQVPNVTITRTLRDGTLDNQVVAHEWGHYLSNRLVYDANGLATRQSSGLGEGWSDFVAMLLAVEPEDARVPSNPGFAGVYSFAGYASGASDVPSVSYYFGVRRYPYSTDFAKNPLTFRHIQSGVALPPGPPEQWLYSSDDNAEPHNTGEVWCEMLWECYAALLRDGGRLTFADARDRMRRYLVASLEMTPADPTLLEARDALLVVAAASDPADFTLFYQAFARRGAGAAAVGADRYSTTNAGVVESYSAAGDLAFVSLTLDDDVASCDHDGILDPGEDGHVTLTLRNVGATNLASTSASITSANAALTFPFGHAVALPPSAPFATTSVTLPVALQAVPALTALDLSASYTDPGLVSPLARAATGDFYVNADAVPSTFESFEAPASTWSTGGNAALLPMPWRRVEAGPTRHRMFVPDPAGRADQWLASPPLAVSSGAPFGFTFRHDYSTEADANAYYDGGVIELSQDGGATWTDIGAHATPTYGDTIAIGAGNPLAGRRAYGGTNPSFPGMDSVRVDLGTLYAGKTVQIRFRFASDAFTQGYGWELDSLSFRGITNAPFLDLVPGRCTLLSSPAPAPGLSLALLGANPVSGTARFRFTLPDRGPAELGVYDVSGRRVAVLASGTFAAGDHDVAWSPRGAARAGVFFARLRAGGRQVGSRIVVMR